MSNFTIKNLDRKAGVFLDNVQRNIRYMSALGMKFDQNVIKQSKGMGISESQEDMFYSNIYGQQYLGAGNDINQREFIAFFEKEYPLRRDFLRKFSMNGEIEYVLELIADEVIIKDDAKFFAYPDTSRLKSILKDEKAKEIVDDLNESFKKVYYAFGFNNGHDAWHYCKKFLIDGFLAFEIIYDGEGDENAQNVIGFKELDPVTLEPEIRVDEDEQEYRVWIQFKGDSERQRELLDANLIYISWARGNFISRLSYVERLVRAFNMLRTMENSRIIWNIINAQNRMKILVPIGSSEVKARTRLSMFRAMYKEEVHIDSYSGEITINGSPNFSYAKQYIIPTKDGQQTEIDAIAPQGYDLSGTMALDYFWKRFIIETKAPMSRFSSFGIEGGGDQGWTSGGDNIAREEIRFNYFITRIRSILEEMLLKPTWTQFCLKRPMFAEDKSLKSSIGLKYTEENLFTEAKKRQIAEKSASVISTLSNITEKTVINGEVADTPYFDPKFLVEKYMKDLTDDDIKLNTKYKNARRDQINRIIAATSRINKSDENSDISGGMGMGGGMDLGGGMDTDMGGGEDLGL